MWLDVPEVDAVLFFPPNSPNYTLKRGYLIRLFLKIAHNMSPQWIFYTHSEEGVSTSQMWKDSKIHYDKSKLQTSASVIQIFVRICVWIHTHTNV